MEVSIILWAQKFGNAGKGFVWEPRFHIPFWSMIYLLFKLKFFSETENSIEFESQYQINHGPEWNVEFLILIKTPYRHFSNFCVLKMSDFTKQNFHI